MKELEPQAEILDGDAVDDRDEVQLGDVRIVRDAEPPKIVVPKRSEYSGDLMFTAESGPVADWDRRRRELLPEPTPAHRRDIAPGGKYEGWDLVRTEADGMRVFVREPDAIDHVVVTLANEHRVVPRERHETDQLAEETDLWIRDGEQPPNFVDPYAGLTDEARAAMLLGGAIANRIQGRQFNITRDAAVRLGIPFSDDDRFLNELPPAEWQAFGVDAQQDALEAQHDPNLFIIERPSLTELKPAPSRPELLPGDDSKQGS